MADKAEIRVGIVGLGTVGGGTATVLSENAGVIASRAIPIRLAAVADIDEPRARAFLDKLGLQDTQLHRDWRQLIDDPDLDIIVETVGGVTLAKDIIIAALSAGKTVVTANKDLMATYGGELLHLASEHQTDLFFEASVAGGIPVIQAVKEALAGNRITSIMGILNGTTNFILTRMSEDGIDFAAALAEAQALGYAEADPSADIEGWDAARKIAILSSIAFNSRVTYDMVPCEGITGISKWDMLYAKEFGYVIKMIAIARHQGCAEEGFIEARVHPLMLPLSHPLAAVRDSYNAVFIEGNAVERTMFFGRGAGALPTGSAIVGDIIQAARNIIHHSKARIGCTCHLSLPMLPLDEVVSKYYIRICVFDRVGVFASLSAALRDCNVSIDAVMQKRRISADKAEIVLITHEVRHADMLAALAIIEKLDCTCEISGYIRVEDEEN
jgi:homoserine dehydrogenase